jgi:hypothetical protein
MPSFPTNAWNKGVLGKGSSRLTGIFPNAFMVGGKLTDNSPTIASTVSNDSGVFIPFSDLTGVLNTSTSEIGNAATAAQNADAEDWSPAGGSKFMLGVLEAAFAAQQNAASADRLANCVVTRSALSVVDEDTLQKTFTVKFKLSHTSQDLEAE